jgi:hypothetical protein
MRKTFFVAGIVSMFIGATLPQAVFSGSDTVPKPVMQSDLDGPPDATIDFEAKQLRLIFGGAEGRGVLHYKGKDYPFRIKGVTVGGAGFTEVEGTATVHRMKSLSDFPGNYNGIGIGAALGQGKGATSFQNGKGVVVTTKGKSSGVALNMGVSSVNIRMK